MTTKDNEAKKDENIEEIGEKSTDKETKNEEEQEDKISDELEKLRELLTRTQADYQNFKFRSERDKEDMIFFLKSKIFKKILPRIDDIERILENTKEEEKTGSLYEGLLALEKLFRKDLDDLGVKSFASIGEEINPNKHEVMTQIPSETPGKIVQEFEKGYLLNDKILRVAKVIVGENS